MAKKKLKLRLTTSGINELSNYLSEYASSFDKKVIEFVERLADVGIIVAEDRLKGTEGEPYITLETRYGETYEGCQYILTAIGLDVLKQWYYGEELIGYEVNELLMEEFGSGKYAKNPYGLDGVGRGSMKGKHPYHPEYSRGESDEPWKWRDNAGLHMSEGRTPSMPMFYASTEMHKKVEKIAKEVFK